MKKLVCDQCGEVEGEGTDIFRVHLTASIHSWSGDETLVPEDKDGYVDLCRMCYTNVTYDIREEED